MTTIHSRKLFLVLAASLGLTSAYALEYEQFVYDTLDNGEAKVTGLTNADGNVEVYAGIPYAKPPVGELRWREPQEPERWEGVRACDAFAPMSMQQRHSELYNTLYRMIGYHEFKPSLTDNFREPVSEDSLYLNIWKPAGEQEKLPVIFYIHGGSLMTGQPSYTDYNGDDYFLIII